MLEYIVERDAGKSAKREELLRQLEALIMRRLRRGDSRWVYDEHMEIEPWWRVGFGALNSNLIV